MTTPELNAQDDDQRMSLDGTEGGLWRVETMHSHYEVDLDEMLITRVAGPHASSTVNDLTRPILELVQCTIGVCGYWTMKAEGNDAIFFEHFWQASTPIVSIRRVDGFGSAL